jgi:Fe-S-cluster containining protein
MTAPCFLCLKPISTSRSVCGACLPKLDALMAQVKRMYARVPDVRCKGKCTASCFNVPLTAIEAAYLEIKYGKKFPVSLHASPGEPPFKFPTLGANATCPFLKDGRCTIYADRPLICRAFGHPLADLACSYGCTDELVDALAPEDFFMLYQILLSFSEPYNLRIMAGQK